MKQNVTEHAYSVIVCLVVDKLSVMMMTLIVSEESLARDRHTES